jgi:hypothetical protein
MTEYVRGGGGVWGGAAVWEGSGRDGGVARRPVSGGYPAAAVLTNVDGSRVVVAGADGVMLPVGEAGTVAGGLTVAVPEGSAATEFELSTALSVVVGAVGVVGADPVGAPLKGLVGDGVMVGEKEPVAGLGAGAWGWSRSGVCGSRNRPRPSPAATNTEPTALCAARTRRRTRTPVLSRSRCAGSKGVYSWASRMIRANSRSK